MSSIVINYRYQSIATGDWYRLISSVSIDFRYRFLSIDYACFSGDKLQQLVAATDHSMCTGRATSCSNTVRDTSQRQIASCVLENFCENLCLRNRILSLQQVAKNQIRLNLCDLLRRQNSVAATKIFTKIQYARNQNDIVSIPPFYCVYSCLNRK